MAPEIATAARSPSWCRAPERAAKEGVLRRHGARDVGSGREQWRGAACTFWPAPSSFSLEVMAMPRRYTKASIITGSSFDGRDVPRLVHAHSSGTIVGTVASFARRVSDEIKLSHALPLASRKLSEPPAPPPLPASLGRKSGAPRPSPPPLPGPSRLFDPCWPSDPLMVPEVEAADDPGPGDSEAAPPPSPPPSATSPSSPTVVLLVCGRLSRGSTAICPPGGWAASATSSAHSSVQREAIGWSRGSQCLPALSSRDRSRSSQPRRPR